MPSARDGTARVVICTWRDLRHEDGGGSELYVETVARGLAAMGNDVTLLCARADGAPSDGIVDGVRYRRRGGRLTVYPAAALALLLRRVRPHAVIDVQNAIPFFSPLVTSCPVIAHVHQSHREQWDLMFGQRIAHLGWWVESRLAPRLYRTSAYTTLSEATRAVLASLGVSPDRVRVLPVGTPELPEPRSGLSAEPSLVTLGRLVPSKRIEILLRSAARLRAAHPGLQVHVIGKGYSEGSLRAEAERLELADAVTFHGWVDEQTKADLLASAWVQALPSVQEGWCLAVAEAGLCRTPSVAFAAAGGVTESIRDGVTGLLAQGGEDAFVGALDRLLADRALRTKMGEAARSFAASRSWAATVDGTAAVIDEVLATARARALGAHRNGPPPAAVRGDEDGLAELLPAEAAL